MYKRPDIRALKGGKKMENREFITVIADIHNRLAEISVRGDDAIRMGEILTRCRGLVMSLSAETGTEGGEAK